MRERYKRKDAKLLTGALLVGTPVVSGWVRGRLPWAANVPGTTVGTDTALGALLFAWGVFGSSTWPLIVGGQLLGGGLGRRAQAAGLNAFTASQQTTT
jgi:hypothetical protein